MKKTSTKLLSVLAAGVIMASAFAGCGGNSSSTASGDNSSNAGSSNTSAFDTSKSLSVITREQGSGTRDAFVELTGVLVKDGDTKTDPTRPDAAIGYISLGSLNDSVKALKIEDVDATAENVKSGEYKISRPFNIAYKGDLSGLAKDFVDYILSSDGQAVISKEGYVSVSENAAYAGTKPEGKITVAGSSSVSPVMEKLIEAYKQINTKAEIELQTSDSSAGMQSALEGTCDIGMASRELKDTETALTSTTIAKDGIAVIVNTNNTTENLTMDQVKAIYTGEAKVWSDITK